MSSEPVHRTVVVVDLARYTELVRSADALSGAKAVASLERRIKALLNKALQVVLAERRLLDDAQAVHTKWIGDGAVCLFEETQLAARFAAAVHHVAADHNSGKNESDQRHFRISIAAGNVVLDDDVVGLPVVVATRLNGAARIGEVVIESSAWEDLPPEEKKRYGGEEVVSGKRDESFLVRRRQVTEPPPRKRRTETAAWFYVRSLEVKDVKGIQQTRLELAQTPEDGPGWYVLAGGNGSGKSTLLRSIAAASAGAPLGRLLDDSWIRNGSEEGTVVVGYVNGSGSSEKAQSQLRFRRSLPARFSSSDKETGNLLAGGYLSGYGPFKRLAGGSDHARNLSGTDSRMARLITLFLEEAALWEVSDWLLKTAFDPSRASFRQDVLSLLSSGLLPGGFLVERFAEGDLLLKTPEGSSVSLRSTSDGLRCMIAMILDMLRGLEDCYGAVDLSGGRVTEPGVVLIDEPDNHLHILWQMKLASWMKEHFPRIQFIVASHSPFICVGADRIWRLDDESGAIVPRALPDEEMKELWNGSIAAILESDAFRVFNTLAPGARDRHMEYLKLHRLSLRGRRLSPAEKARLAELEQEILGPVVPPDPEFDKLFP